MITFNHLFFGLILLFSTNIEMTSYGLCMDLKLNKPGRQPKRPVCWPDPLNDIATGMICSGKSERHATSGWTHWALMFFFVTVVGIIATADPLYGGKVVDRVMAIVNDEIISLYELDQRVRPYANKIKNTTSSPTEQNELLRKVREENLNLLIDEKLADQEIRRLQIRVADTEVDREIERFKSDNQLTDEEFQKVLATQGSSLEEFRREIKNQILRARLVNWEIRSKIVITHEEIEAYYNSHPEEFGSENKYFLKNILMIAPAIQSQDEDAEVINRLNRIHQKLMDGEPFDAMAREYSQAPNAVDGGSLGLISKNALAPQIQEALAPLKPGEFTDIIKTDQGYQIFYLEDFETHSADHFDKVKDKIEDKLYKQVINQQYEKGLQDLRTRAHIKLIR